VCIAAVQCFGGGDLQRYCIRTADWTVKKGAEMAVRLALLLVPLLLAACSTVTPQTYVGNEPRLVPELFFSGPLRATGVLKNRSGEVTRRFTADIEAYWRDGVGTLDEDFVFDDGERDKRVWTLKPRGDGRYDATAGDVVGVGEAEVAGNAMFLDYVLRVPYGDGSIDLRIDDRMYLVSPDRLINESVMTKWGVRVGEILLVIERLEPGP
jgi:hypothetical protein